MYVDYLHTPIGTLEICASGFGVAKLMFSAESDSREINVSEITRLCKTQLQEYFDGKRSEFDVPLDLQGTDFQKTVWDCLLMIPCGETVSYQDIAIKLKKPKSVRAVGAANGKNPVGIIVPCHRVIGSNQTLTGYAGGLDRKAWLLDHEGVKLHGNRIVASDNWGSSQMNLFKN